MWRQLTPSTARGRPERGVAGGRGRGRGRGRGYRYHTPQEVPVKGEETWDGIKRGRGRRKRGEGSKEGRRKVTSVQWGEAIEGSVVLLQGLAEVVGGQAVLAEGEVDAAEVVEEEGAEALPRVRCYGAFGSGA